MKCKKCKNKLFTIEIETNRDDCPENGAFDNDKNEYIFDEKIIDMKELFRNHVKNEGECNLSTAHGMGCTKIICSKCGLTTNIPMYWF